jgi:hypothetical protein
MIGKPIQLLFLLISFIKQVIGGEVFLLPVFSVVLHLTELGFALQKKNVQLLIAAVDKAADAIPIS